MILLQKNLGEISEQLETYKNALSLLNEEKGEYMNECEKLKEKIKNLEDELSKNKNINTSNEGGVDNDKNKEINELKEKIAERDGLIETLQGIISGDKDINALKKDCYLYAHKIEKGDILAQGTHIFKMEFCGVILNKLFYGKHNWACGMSYFNSIDSFKNSLLQYDVFCYECMPYVREEGKYCIETKLPLEASKVNIDHYDENRRVAILACQSANNPEAEGWQGETALKFLGIYNLDIAKSKEENYLAFKLANKCLYI